MEPMMVVKFAALYALEGFVIAVVGATLLAGLYQLLRNGIRSALGARREYEAGSPAMVPESK